MIEIYYETKTFYQVAWEIPLTLNENNYLVVTDGIAHWTCIEEITYSDYHLPAIDNGFPIADATWYLDHMHLLDKLATVDSIPEFIREYPEYLL